MNVIRSYRDDHCTYINDLRLSDFPIYGSRLQEFQTEMKEWRPKKLTHLAIRPYSDPVTYYAFWFAIFIGFASVLALGGVVATAYAALKSIPKQ